MLEQKLGKKIPVRFDNKRPGDQDVYISCINKVKRSLQWSPKINLEAGLDRLILWAQNNLSLIQSVL